MFLISWSIPEYFSKNKDEIMDIEFLLAVALHDQHFLFSKNPAVID
jgi:hypothetical protein